MQRDFSTTDQILIQTNSNEFGQFCVHVVKKGSKPKKDNFELNPYYHIGKLHN